VNEAAPNYAEAVGMTALEALWEVLKSGAREEVLNFFCKVASRGEIITNCGG
jgi:hypothetical protein